MSSAAEAKRELRQASSPRIAAVNQRFFKTEKGEYGYGDKFLGLRTAYVRKIAKKYAKLPLNSVLTLVKSKFHEERLCGLIILVNKYDKTESERERIKIYKAYVGHFRYVNNWDLVDVTCPYIIGRHLYVRDRKILYTWARSPHLWTRRIAMLANWWFIRKGDLSEVFKIAEILLKDDHDLIHKAVGWMIRVAADKNMNMAETFLRRHYTVMPRTMLRYAIEKFPETKRQKYLKGKI